MKTPAVLVAACVFSCMPVGAEPVLLISIDGLHPDYVIDADRHGLDTPTLRAFVKRGAYATGVIGVVPTVTYPSHTTMVTGVPSAAHGIASNTPFDPLQTNREGWYWYAEDIAVPTLWDVVKSAGGISAAVNWPVTVGEQSIDLLIPEMWWAQNGEDLKLIRALSRPAGFLKEIEGRLGPFVDGYTDTLESDRVRTRFALDVLDRHALDFMAVHLIALDGSQHRDGPFVGSAFATLEALDGMIGELIAAARSNDPSTVVAIVSDHGFIATHTAVNLRERFVAAGLIELDDTQREGGSPRVRDWQAQAWPGAGAAAIVLRDRTDEALRARVAQLLDELQAEPGNGIARVLRGTALASTESFPGADFLVEFAPGFYFGSALQGELLTRAASRGTHGYLPERPEMHAAFFIEGEGIASARKLGVVRMVEIAPTLAEILGVELPSSSAPALPVQAPRRN